MKRGLFLPVKVLIAAVLLFTQFPLFAQKDTRPNVLLIAVDDLNDWIGSMGGHPDTRTPNIDRLASRGVLFTNAHSQGTMCNPSRISIMWGKRPSSTGFYENHFPVAKSPEFSEKY